MVLEHHSNLPYTTIEFLLIKIYYFVVEHYACTSLLSPWLPSPRWFLSYKVHYCVEWYKWRKRMMKKTAAIFKIFQSKKNNLNSFTISTCSEEIDSKSLFFVTKQTSSDYSRTVSILCSFWIYTFSIIRRSFSFFLLRNSHDQLETIGIMPPKKGATNKTTPTTENEVSARSST
jgi:hypothetical protein